MILSPIQLDLERLSPADFFVRHSPFAAHRLQLDGAAVEPRSTYRGPRQRRRSLQKSRPPGPSSRFTAHSAFDDPGTPAGAPPRESIETRTFAFFD